MLVLGSINLDAERNIIHVAKKYLTVFYPTTVDRKNRPLPESLYLLAPELESKFIFVDFEEAEIETPKERMLKALDSVQCAQGEEIALVLMVIWLPNGLAEQFMHAAHESQNKVKLFTY